MYVGKDAERTVWLLRHEVVGRGIAQRVDDGLTVVAAVKSAEQTLREYHHKDARYRAIAA